MRIASRILLVTVSIAMGSWARDVSAICRTCGNVANGGTAPTFCTASATTSGAQHCRTTQNKDGSYTCALSGNDCTSGVGSGLTCTQTPDPTANKIDPTNPAGLPSGVTCSEVYWVNQGSGPPPKVYTCSWNETTTDCSGGGGGEGSSCGADGKGAINGLGQCVLDF